MGINNQVAEVLLQVKAVSLRINPPYVWASGLRSPIYTDNRILISFPEERKVIVRLFLQLLNDIDFYGFAGTATAGIPWASFLAQSLDKPMVFVRSSTKDHGKENLLEGKIEQGKTYIVVEDLISTGGSSVKAVEEVRRAGGIVTECIAIFTYEMEQARKNFEQSQCTLSALTDFSTLLKTARFLNYISAEEEILIAQWKENPAEWKGIE